MHLRRIEIRNYRKLQDGVAIGELPAGLSVIAGDNEEGKSTVLAAIQSALFDRHTIGGKAAKDMQPFGSSVRPEVNLSFEIGGEAYRLEKGFCSKPAASLKTPAGTFDGNEAEEQLQHLLGFTPNKSRGAGAEHRGLSGLLWVEQGQSYAPLPIHDDSRSTLLDALEGEVGTLVGGDRGRALIGAVEKRRAHFLTRTGQPTGDLKKADTALSSLREQLAQAETDLRVYDQQVERLQSLKADQARDATDDILRQNQQRFEAATAAWRAIAALQEKQERAEERRRAAAVAAQHAGSALEQRRKRVAQLAADRAAIADDQRDLLQAQAASAAADAAFTAADRAAKTARQALAQAETQLQDARQEEARGRQQQELATRRETLAAADAADAAAVQAREALALIRIDAPTLETLRALERDQRMLQARAEAVATTIALAPDAGRAASLDGVDLDPEQVLRLTRPVTLQLEGYGALSVTPGGEDMSGLTAEIEAATAKLEARLADAGCTTLDEAAAAVERRAALEADIARHTAERDFRTDGNLDALRQSVADLEAALKETEREDDTAGPDIADAQQAVQQGQQTLRRAEAERDGLRETRDGARTRLAGLKARADQIEATLVAQAARLTEEQAETPDADLAAAAAQTQATLAEQTRAATTLAADLAAASPEAAELTLQRAKDALRTTEARVQETADNIVKLSAELRGAGQIGLGEKVAELQAALSDAERRQADLAGEAAALTLLYDTLSEEERTAKDAFIGPVRERIAPYLRLVFPGADLALDTDDLSVTGLSRDGATEPFETLSIGTREQLAVLVRLAIADFLLEKGQPVTVILDDTLVYADDDRFEAMLNALTKAAKNLQIIILTCRERDYRALGAPIFRLRDSAPFGD